ncbi:hypothetical protein EK21DRAFT_117150 [Setomelanomma holmii]|uniref:Nascent polypeptide-associated complex subunit alpha-like UBA domain-containing protein n=1 Tax=Setomelanomma holmii TaxID=210430 RepID=A0A9P4LH59_9PLEO|nr:hypothetical protein EK21DRAFT_117150 [Setomelanomma holmii]
MAPSPDNTLLMNDLQISRTTAKKLLRSAGGDVEQAMENAFHAPNSPKRISATTVPSMVLKKPLRAAGGDIEKATEKPTHTSISPTPITPTRMASTTKAGKTSDPHPWPPSKVSSVDGDLTFLRSGVKAQREAIFGQDAATRPPTTTRKKERFTSYLRRMGMKPGAGEMDSQDAPLRKLLAEKLGTEAINAWKEPRKPGLIRNMGSCKTIPIHQSPNTFETRDTPTEYEKVEFALRTQQTLAESPGLDAVAEDATDAQLEAQVDFNKMFKKEWAETLKTTETASLMGLPGDMSSWDTLLQPAVSAPAPPNLISSAPTHVDAALKESKAHPAPDTTIVSSAQPRSDTFATAPKPLVQVSAATDKGLIYLSTTNPISQHMNEHIKESWEQEVGKLSKQSASPTPAPSTRSRPSALEPTPARPAPYKSIYSPPTPVQPLRAPAPDTTIPSTTYTLFQSISMADTREETEETFDTLEAAKEEITSLGKLHCRVKWRKTEQGKLVRVVPSYSQPKDARGMGFGITDNGKAGRWEVKVWININNGEEKKENVQVRDKEKVDKGEVAGKS